MTSREDWLLMALAHAPQAIASVADLSDHLVQLRVECSEEVGARFYQFQWRDDHPECVELRHDLETLRHGGLVIEARDDAGGTWHALTMNGRARVRAALRGTSQQARESLAWGKWTRPGERSAAA